MAFVIRLCVFMWLEIMKRHHFLTMEQAMALLEADEDEDDEVVAKLRSSSEVNVVYIPPDVDVQSDNEDIDDDMIDADAPLNMEIAGEIEVEYEEVEVDVFNEDVDEDIVFDVNKNDPPPSKKSETSTEELPHYKSSKEFGILQWENVEPQHTKSPVNIEDEKIKAVVEKLGE